MSTARLAMALRSATVKGNHDLHTAKAAGGEPERTLVSDRYRSIVDVYVLLRHPDGKILLLERAGTGYADGQLCPPSGHLEAGESVVQGGIREAREETGVLIDPADLAFSHVVHHRNPEGQPRIGFFFTADRWQGEPANREPRKCAGLYWVDPAWPPENTVPYTAAALAAISHGAAFSLDGW
jgi:8-oxo-dGTP diphosphatase